MNQQHAIGIASTAYMHQKIIRNILVNYFLETSYQKFEPIFDFSINPNDMDQERPDVIFYENNTPVVIIEIEHRKGGEAAGEGQDGTRREPIDTDRRPHSSENQETYQ